MAAGTALVERGVRMIERCCLAVITERGRRVIPPSLSKLDADEEDFLSRHVDRLRKKTAVEHTRGRFRPGSTLKADFTACVTGDDDEFVAVASRLVTQLAHLMQGVNSASCVTALVVGRDSNQGQTVSFLKLDAEIEAAQLDRSGNGVRLRVFKDLLPRPGEIQKGISWPDPRMPQSELIVLDTNPVGTAKYFQNAFAIEASPTLRQTERVLTEALAELPETLRATATSLLGEGGPADEVLARIRTQLPDFQPDAPELGAGGALAGTIGRQFLAGARKIYEADGIELRVPLSLLDRVTTRRVGTHFETTIITESPLSPVERNVGESA